jgi:hypothetical protein
MLPVDRITQNSFHFIVVILTQMHHHRITFTAGRTIETRCKEHVRYIGQSQLEKSVVAEHSLETEHSINFRSTSILDKTPGYMDCLKKEAIEIRLHHQKC